MKSYVRFFFLPILLGVCAARANPVDLGPSVVASGSIASDGWMTSGARLMLLGTPDTSAWLCTLEIDAIAIDEVAEITVANTSNYRRIVRLTAGRHYLLLPCSGTAESTDYTFTGPARCVLPAPDNRRALARILFVKPVTWTDTRDAISTSGIFSTIGINGVQSDGWASNYTTLELPKGSARRAKLKVEFPGWAGQEVQTVDINCGRLAPIRVSLHPGQHDIDIELPDAVTTVTLKSAHSFRLPEPDSRTVSLRLVSLSPSP